MLMGYKKWILAFMALGLCFITVLGYNYKISKLEKELKDKNELIIIAQNKNTLCNAYLDKQNLAIKALEIKDVNLSTKEIERVKRIFVKDKTCEAELKAYKELFGAVR